LAGIRQEFFVPNGLVICHIRFLKMLRPSKESLSRRRCLFFGVANVIRIICNKCSLTRVIRRAWSSQSCEIVIL
jgi:hypothetical protein